MTPEEVKANELIEKYANVPMAYIDNDAVKQCAIIAVKEIITLNALVETNDTSKFAWVYANPFWKKVLEVLEK